jgi:hypothetical protein
MSLKVGPGFRSGPTLPRHRGATLLVLAPRADGVRRRRLSKKPSTREGYRPGRRLALRKRAKRERQDLSVRPLAVDGATFAPRFRGGRISSSAAASRRQAGFVFEAVCAHELEGVVAKRRGSRHLPGERGWVKIKNRNYWRYEMERESAITSDARSSSSDAIFAWRRARGVAASTVKEPAERASSPRRRALARTCQSTK